MADDENTSAETYADKFVKPRPAKEKKGAHPDADKKANAFKLIIFGLALICGKYFTDSPESWILPLIFNGLGAYFILAGSDHGLV